MQLRTTLAAACFCLASLVPGAVLAKTELTMGIISGENSIYYNEMGKPFVDLVSELTGGEVEIKIMPAGTVGSVLKLHEAVEDGLIDMAQTTPIFLGSTDLVNAMIASFPTGLGVDSYSAWLFEGGGLDLWQEHRREKMNMHALVTSVGPSEWFAHSNKPIKSREDLADLRYRTLGNWAEIVEKNFGAAPTVVAGSEIYGMLEKGGLDLAEYSLPSENKKIGFHEIAKYIVYPGIHAPAWAFETIMTTEKWDELPESARTAMTLAAEIIYYRSLNRMILADLKAVDELRGGGNEFVRVDDAFVEEARVAAREWALEEAKKAEAEGDDLPMRVATSIFEFQDFWRDNSGYLVLDYVPGIQPKQ